MVLYSCSELFIGNLQVKRKILEVDFTTYLNLCDKKGFFKLIKVRKRKKKFMQRRNFFFKNNYNLYQFGFIKFYTFFFRFLYKYMIFLVKYTYALTLYKNTFNTTCLNLFFFSKFVNLTKKTFLLKYSDFFFRKSLLSSNELYFNFLPKYTSKINITPYSNVFTGNFITPSFNTIKDLNKVIVDNDIYSLRAVSINSVNIVPGYNTTDLSLIINNKISSVFIKTKIWNSYNLYILFKFFFIKIFIKKNLI